MQTVVLRLWLPDRPGALGQVASRIGAVRGDVVGIEILERGGGQVVDELLIDLPPGTDIGLLTHEVRQVDGVAVEEVRLAPATTQTPLELAAEVVAATSVPAIWGEVLGHCGLTLRAAWAAIVDVDGGDVVAAVGEVPPAPWIVAYAAGVVDAGCRTGSDTSPGGTAAVPLADTGVVLCLGRPVRFHTRELDELALVADIAGRAADRLGAWASLVAHPSRRPAALA